MPSILTILAYLWVALTAVELAFGGRVFFKRLRVKLDSNFTETHYVGLGLKYSIKYLAMLILPLTPLAYTLHVNLNPAERFIGVDMPHYNEAFLELSKVCDWLEALKLCFTRVMGGQRPLYFTLLYLLSRAMDPVLTIRVEPIMLMTLLLLSTYLLYSAVIKDGLLALIAVFLSASSPFTASGVYGGFYSNWLAIVEVYASMAFLIKYFREGELKHLASSTTLSCLALFTHPWTWDVYMATLLTYLLLSLSLKLVRRGGSRRLLGLSLIVSINGLIDYFKEFILKMFGGYLAAESVVRMGWIGLQWIPDYWLNLRNLFTLYVGGAYTNWIVLVFSIIGLIHLHFSRSEFSSILYIWTILASTLFPFSSLDLQGRLFLILPLNLIYPLGFLYLVSYMKVNGLNGRLIKPLIFFVSLAQLNYFFRCIMHLL